MEADLLLGELLGARWQMMWRKETAPIARLLSIITMIATVGVCSGMSWRAHSEKMQHPATHSMTLERLLTLPLLQGEHGLHQVTREVFDAAGYAEAPGTLNGEIVNERGPLMLADGYRLNAVIDYTAAGVLSIAVDRTPCFRLENAARIVGAVPVGPVSYPFAEGPNYDTRSAVANGVDVNLGTFSPGEMCLTEIHLVDIERASKFVAENKLDLPAKNLSSRDGKH
ncbi:hypothetical protein ABIE09_002066 [Lysobacter enzymogenes]|uniref:hypothetical protein n=1 Tax=Lysobacter enzymogenes TaxID=69 RepID=UPI00339AAE08